MARLAIFPESGWCRNGNKRLGKYLAKRFNMEYECPGPEGYAWNSGSYWTITTASSKLIYNFNEIEHFVDNDDITSGRPLVAKNGSDKKVKLPEIDKNEDSVEYFRKLCQNSTKMYDYNVINDEAYGFRAQDFEALRPSKLRHTRRSKLSMRMYISTYIKRIPTHNYIVNVDYGSLNLGVFEPSKMKWWEINYGVIDNHKKQLLLRRSRR